MLFLWKKLQNAKASDLTLDEAVDVDKTLKRMNRISVLFQVLWTVALGGVYCVGLVKALSYSEFDPFLGRLVFLWPLAVLGSLRVYHRN